MNELQIFENNEFGKIRMVTIDGKPYAVGVDVARALEYANASKAVIDHCDDFLSWEVTDSLGRVQRTNVIPQGDIIRLIVGASKQSKNEIIKEKAKKFESWIFDEVIPQVLETGSYSVKQAPALPDFTNPVIAARAWADEVEKKQLAEAKVKVLTADNAKQSQIIGELKPKADYTDKILQNKGLVAITQIAKDYGMSGKTMNQKLHELKIIYKIGKQWVLYADYQAKGYTHSDTFNFKHNDGRDDVTMNTKWTQKGRLFLYEELKKHGILPMIEQC